MTTDHLPTALMLTGPAALAEVTLLSTRTPHQWAVHLTTGVHDLPIIGTEAQLIGLRDALDHAVDRLRTIDNQTRRTNR